MTSTKTKELNIEELPQEARQCHICPDMNDKNLLSVPVLCDAGCMCIFCQKKVMVIKNNKIIMEGPRDPKTNLWCIPIGSSPPPAQTVPTVPFGPQPTPTIAPNVTRIPLAIQTPEQEVCIVPTISKYNNEPTFHIEPHTANSAYTQRSAAELQAYHHSILGGPPIATLIDAIKNNRLSTFPGLSVEGYMTTLTKVNTSSNGTSSQI